MNIVGPRFGNDVDNSAQGAARFISKTVVDHAKFLDRLLRRSRPLHASLGIDEVRAVYSDDVAEGALSAKGNLRDFKFSERGPETGAARGYARRQ